jgi:hypothetical protein
MGLLGKIFAVTAASKALRNARANSAAQSEYIPANSTDVSTGLGARTNAVLGRAGEIYKQNPKLVGGIALLGAAALLASMKRR